MTVHWKILDESDISAELDSQIREFLCAHFPEWRSVFERHRKWHGLSPLFTVLGRNAETEEIIAHTSVVVRRITTTWNFRYEAASFQGVLVSPEYRRNGIAQNMLKIALHESKSRDLEFAILFCKEPLVNYYIKHNWRLADDSIVMWNNRDLPIAMRSNCPMYYMLTDKPFPEGPIDVHSL